MKNKQRQISFLLPKEINAILAGIVPEGERNFRDIALIEVLFSTGLRISEALALTRKDFQGEQAGTKELTIIGKGGFQRVIFFSKPAVRAIALWLSARSDSEPELFPITPRCAQIMVKKRALEAGVEKRITPHVFRHSLATDLLRRGVDIRMVGEFLGHRNLNNTMIYTHVVNEQLKSIHKKLYK